MKIAKRVFSHIFLLDCSFKEVKPVCGIRSNTVDNLHHLLIDCDGIEKFEFAKTWAVQSFPLSKVFYYRTVHGFHIIVDTHHGFSYTAYILLECGFADINYVINGIRRGYWFLEVKNKDVANELEKHDFLYMVIERSM